MVNPFLVGCDPEFIVVQANGVVANVAMVLPHDGPLGYDHGGRIAEVRPEPAKGTWTLVKRIRAILVENEKAGRLKELGRWRAGAMVGGESLGGHIHIDQSIHDFIHHDRVAALDKVFKVLEDLEVLPGKEMTARRHHPQGYGRWGSVRESDDGTRFEYRSAPSWLYHPRVAFLCLTAGKLAAADPKGTLELFKTGQDWKDFLRWLSNYAPKDINARRLVEMLGSQPLHEDVEADVKEVWARWKA